VPANAVLAIAGAIDLDEAWTLVERYFGSFPVSARPPRANPAPAAPRATELVVDDPRAALARVRHAWLGPPRGHEDEWSLAVLADVLPRAGVGPLWQALVYASSRCQRVGASSHGARLGGEFHLTADLRTGVAPALAADEFAALLARVAAGEVLTEEIIGRTVGRAEAGLIWPLESMAHRAAELARAVATYDDPQWGPRRLGQLRAVTPATIGGAVARWLGAERRVSVTTRPE
jgi:zinc protease